MNLSIFSRQLPNLIWNDDIHLFNTGKSILGQNFANRLSNFLQTWFFFKGFSPSGDHKLDFEIKTKRSSEVGENKSILTTLSNYNSLQKSAFSLPKIVALDAKSRLKEMKFQSWDKLILGHLNINSIRSKIEAKLFELTFIIDHNLDIFFIPETKLDGSFPTVQSLIKGFSALYRFDRNSKGGGLPFYIREDITSKILTYSSNCDIETFLVEINLRKRKWLLNGSYNPNKSQTSHHLECLNSLLVEHSMKYENYVFIDHFKVNISDSSLKKFCSSNGIKNLIKKPTCYKNSEKLTCIDLILTNQPTFQHSTVFETGLSDFNLLTVTEFKMSFQIYKPHIVTYRNCKNHDMPLDMKLKAFVL